MTPYQTYKNARYFGSLDGLRALSILAVIWHHVSDDALADTPLLKHGPFGVDLFFAISTFLLTTLMLRERDRTGGVSLRTFYARRILRIWPLYFTMLGVYTLLVGTMVRHTHEGEEFFKTLPYFLTFTSNWSPHHTSIFFFVWSLAVQEQFYLFWPSLLKWFRPGYAAIFLVLLVALDVAAVVGLPSPVRMYPIFIEKTAAGFATPLCLGAMVALVLHGQRGFEIAYRVLGSKWSAPAAMLLLMIGRIIAPRLGDEWALQEWVALPLVIGACVVREDHGAAPLLTWRVLRLIGAVSYGIYLMHSLVMHAVRDAGTRLGIDLLALHFLPLFFVVTSVVSIGVAWLSLHYYESIFISLKSRYLRRGQDPAAKIDPGSASALASAPAPSAQPLDAGLSVPAGAETTPEGTA